MAQNDDIHAQILLKGHCLHLRLSIRSGVKHKFARWFIRRCRLDDMTASCFGTQTSAHLHVTITECMLQVTGHLSRIFFHGLMRSPLALCVQEERRHAEERYQEDLRLISQDNENEDSPRRRQQQQVC